MKKCQHIKIDNLELILNAFTSSLNSAGAHSIEAEALDFVLSKGF